MAFETEDAIHTAEAVARLYGQQEDIQLDGQQTAETADAYLQSLSQLTIDSWDTALSVDRSVRASTRIEGTRQYLEQTARENLAAYEEEVTQLKPLAQEYLPVIHQWWRDFRQTDEYQFLREELAEYPYAKVAVSEPIPYSLPFKAKEQVYFTGTKDFLPFRNYAELIDDAQNRGNIQEAARLTGLATGQTEEWEATFVFRKSGFIEGLAIAISPVDRSQHQIPETQLGVYEYDVFSTSPSELFRRGVNPAVIIDFAEQVSSGNYVLPITDKIYLKEGV